MLDGLLRFMRGFWFAFRGLAWLFFSERNARIHLLAAAAVSGAGIWWRISAVEWCLVALACGVVIAAEAMNTAIEKLADRVTVEDEERIRVVKDVAAAGVLAAAVAAAVVGALVFGPRLLALR
ncbi:MAG: diacylglycerol kinase family protein [Verrucomicrobiaceae bacterium]|nr:diacylglycerol kinase family protein [Verrucomicrobiaceae bacterium]